MTTIIRLFCAGGFSTSLLVNKMNEAAAAAGFDCEIHAYALSTVEENGAGADVILLGPQVRYALKKYQAMFPDKVVTDIPMRMYGTMDGKGTIEMCQKLLAEKKG